MYRIEEGGKSKTTKTYSLRIVKVHPYLCYENVYVDVPIGNDASNTSVVVDTSH